MSDIPSVVETYARITGRDPLATGKRVAPDQIAVPCIATANHKHGDRDPSLHIHTVKDAFICRACKAQGRSIAMVIAAGEAHDNETALKYLGVEREDAEPQAPPPESKIVATYPYYDAQGQLAYEVVRFEPKRFLQRRKGETGLPVWNLEGVRRFPYNLAMLQAAAEADYPVYVVEGEKDAEALIERGRVATTNAGGAAWTWTADFLEFFRGVRRVVVIADNDEPGKKAAWIRAKALTGYVDEVSVLEAMPGVPHKGDVSDYFAKHTVEDFDAAVVEAKPVEEETTTRSLAIVSVYERMRGTFDPPMGVPFGIKKIDDEIGGMHPGQVTILAARTGVGKSAMAERIATGAACSSRVLYYSLEMGAKRAVERIIARGEGKHVRDWTRAGREVPNARWIREMDLHVVDKSRGVTPELIDAKIVRLCPKLVIIDHARHLAGWISASAKSRADLAPADIMYSLTEIAVKRDVHILLLSQCSRSADGRRPTLSDLRDSGAVEEAADNVLFLHRPFQYSVEGEADDTAELLIWKSRSSGTGIAHLRWNGETMSFHEPRDQFEEARHKRCCERQFGGGRKGRDSA